jgi:hypothetical protein
MTYDQQAIEQPERDCRHHEQVHRGNPISMCLEPNSWEDLGVRTPSLRFRLA